MKILFCSDGSALAEHAVRFGALIAAGCGAEATILGISERPGTEDALLQSLRRSQEVLRRHKLAAELITKAGRPVPEIVRRTQETRYDLVVIGAERRHDHRPFLRSVKAYQITEAIAPPVLMYLGERTALRHILLCSGGGPQTAAAVRFTGTIARSTQAVVTLFHVLPAPPAMFAGLSEREADVDRILHSDSDLGRHLRQHRQTLTEMGVTCTVRLRQGMVLPELLAELREANYDLVVAGSAVARDPLRAYMLGNLTREVINHAEWPVLIARDGTRPHSWAGRAWGLFSGKS